MFAAIPLDDAELAVGQILELREQQPTTEHGECAGPRRIGQGTQRRCGSARDNRGFAVFAHGGGINWRVCPGE
jgi:hypothetical protein